MNFFEKLLRVIRAFGTPEILVLLILLALFLVYGRSIRRIGTRGIVATGVLCALAGALGAALRNLPGIQPTSFLVTMVGVILGPGAGLAAGAVSALLFDFLSVVSVYTPWRMALWGLMGLGGAYLPGKLWIRAIYGFLGGFLFGWIMNLVFIMDGFLPLNWATVFASCVSSFWFDLTHAVCNACLLALLSKPLETIARRSHLDREGGTRK